MSAIAILDLPTPDPSTLDDPARGFAIALADRYAIKRVIGRGGMGVVYLARDRRLNRLVAIKTLPPHLASDPAVRERFLREAQMAAGLSHPNIVPIHGADEIDGHVFFVMGLIDGESLAARIRTHGRLEAAEVLRYLCDVAAALAHAHPRGVIHRDVKPENILIDRSTDRAVVTDFGIARLVEAGPLTATGQVLGTVHYVSPEQASGDAVDARSDLYSLGVVGYVALSGTFPFDSTLASAILVAHVTRTPPPLATVCPGISPTVATIMDRLLAKNPDRRYATAALLLDALEAARLDIRRVSASSRPTPTLVSDTEAHVVWRRAAELQAMTGAHAHPAPVPVVQRDPEADAARTSGLRVDDVRAAGSEAGIGTAFLNQVLVERGLAPTPDVALTEHPAVDDGVARKRARWHWAGAPLELIEEADVIGEVQVDDFERIVALARDATGDMGSPTARFRELGWRFDSGGQTLELSVVPQGGRTRVRLVQSMRWMGRTTIAGSTALGVAAAPVVASVAYVVMNAIAYTPGPEWLSDMYIGGSAMRVIALVLGGLAIPTCIHLGRRLVQRSHRRRASRLRTLLHAITATVRDAVREAAGSRDR